MRDQASTQRCHKAAKSISAINQPALCWFVYSGSFHFCSTDLLVVSLTDFFIPPPPSFGLFANGMGEPENEASSEADQGSDQLESDRETGPQSKNACDPHAKRKKSPKFGIILHKLQEVENVITAKFTRSWKEHHPACFPICAPITKEFMTPPYLHGEKFQLHNRLLWRTNSTFSGKTVVGFGTTMWKGHGG